MYQNLRLGYPFYVHLIEMNGRLKAVKTEHNI